MSFRGFQSTNGGEEPNDWSRLSETLASNVQKISQNVNQIQQLIAQLETSQDSELLRTQLHEVQETTSQLTKVTNSCLKELAQLPQLVQSFISVDQNRRNPLINSLNASNNKRLNFMSDNNSKQFSVEKFMTSSSLVSKRSNFYEGKTVFGGANASRAARLAGTTPYNLQHRHHLAPVLRVNVESSKRLVESSQPLSSASQRILEKLEKAATPLQDARRIPSSAQLKNYFQTSDLLHRSTKRPKLGATPVFSQTSSEQAFQPKRWELKLSDKDSHKVSATETTHQLISSNNKNLNKYLIDSNDIKSNETFGGIIMRKDITREEIRPKNQTLEIGDQKDSSDNSTAVKPLTMPSILKLSDKDNNKVSPNETENQSIIAFNNNKDLIKYSIDSNENKSNETFGGKMLRKDTKREERRNRYQMIDNYDQKDSFDDLTTAKPLTIPSTLPQFSFGSNSSTTKSSLTTVITKVTEIQDLEFKFSEPPLKDRDQKTAVVPPTGKNGEKPFVFSSPLSAITQKLSNDSEKNEIESNKVKQPSLSEGWGDKFKPATGTWSCSVCMVNNPPHKTKCLACEEPKPGVTNKIENKITFSLTPSSGIDSMISSQENPIVSSTFSATPPLSINNSSSAQKELVFGSHSPKLPSFSSESSIATTKPDISLTATTGNTDTTTTATTTNSETIKFGANINTLFGSNPNKGLTLGNSTLNSSQTPSVGFTIPLSDSSNTTSNISFGLNANNMTDTSADINSKSASNSLFAFGSQKSDQFSSPLTQKSFNSTNADSKNSSQFSFGLSSNPSTGQTNSNLFANAINPAQNNISFTKMAPTVPTPVVNSSPFTFGGFGSNPSTPAMQPTRSSTQPTPQQSQTTLPLPSFNFSSQPTFATSSTTPSATPTAPLNINNSSSAQKDLVFGSPKPNLQSFSSQPSIAVTKPSFSFNATTGNTSTTTTTTESAFGANPNTLFGSNPKKGFTFGNSTLNSSQTPGFSFTIPLSNSSNSSSNMSFGLNADTSADTNSKPASNSLFAFGTQNSDQFSSPLTQKTSNNTNNNSKPNTSSQFSFGLSSNPSTGQTNNLFANAISPTQNSLTFNPMAPTGPTPAVNSSPFTFGSFGSNPSTTTMQPIWSPPQPTPQQPQTSLPPPSFNFSAQPSFDFGSLPNTGAQPTGPVFQFSADQMSSTAAPNRSIKKAKRRLKPT